MHSTLPSTFHINEPAPDFALPDQHGQIHRLSDYRGKIVVVNFWSAECPWSERADKSLLALVKRFPEQVALLPIASNQNEPNEMINEASCQRNIPFVLRDAGSRVADEWQAQTTPHAFVIDSAGVLRYRGPVDDVTFRKRTPERFYAEEAVGALLNGGLPELQESPPYGCVIVRMT